MVPHQLFIMIVRITKCMMNGEKTFHCVYVCRCRYIDLCVCIYVHMYVSFMHMHVNVLCMRCCRLASLEAADLGIMGLYSNTYVGSV